MIISFTNRRPLLLVTSKLRVTEHALLIFWTSCLRKTLPQALDIHTKLMSLSPPINTWHRASLTIPRIWAEAKCCQEHHIHQKHHETLPKSGPKQMLWAEQLPRITPVSSWSIYPSTQKKRQKWGGMGWTRRAGSHDWTNAWHKQTVSLNLWPAQCKSPLASARYCQFQSDPSCAVRFWPSIPSAERDLGAWGGCSGACCLARSPNSCGCDLSEMKTQRKGRYYLERYQQR